MCLCKYLIPIFLDLNALIHYLGYFGLGVFIFAETGLLVGFFLPGDSLLFTAGFLASQYFFEIRWLLPLVFFSALLGDSTGYYFGKKIGPKIFTRPDGIFLNKSNIRKTQSFYSLHGGKTIILARFLPIIRTLAPLMAGVGAMPYLKKFLPFSLLGSLIWAVGITLAGFYLGKIIPQADKYILPIVLLIILISLVPSLYHIAKDEATRKRLLSKIHT